jgi:hypothetical protein
MLVHSEVPRGSISTNPSIVAGEIRPASFVRV